MSRSQGRCRPEPAPFRPERHVADSDTFPRSRSSGWDGDLEPGGPIARTGPHGEQEAGARRARGALKGAPPGRQLGAGSQHGTEQATGTATAPPSPARDCPLSEPDQALARRPDGRVHSLQAGVLIAPIPAGTRSPSGQSAVAGSISTRAPGHRGHYRRHPPGDVHRRCGPDDLVDDLPTRASVYVRPVGHSCVDQYRGTEVTTDDSRPTDAPRRPRPDAVVGELPTGRGLRPARSAGVKGSGHRGRRRTRAERADHQDRCAGQAPRQRMTLPLRTFSRPRRM